MTTSKRTTSTNYTETSSQAIGNSLSPSEIINQFKQAMIDFGIMPPERIIADGALHRFKIEGKLNGAYVLHLDGKPAGYFQDFKLGIKQNWNLARKVVPFSDFQRQAFNAKCEADRVKRESELALRHEAAARKAHLIWLNSEPASPGHPYLVKKRVQPHLIRQKDNTLLIPMMCQLSDHKIISNIQFITENGTKRFLSGGKKKGCFCRIGDENTDKILICEGFATGASLHEDSGYMVFVAFDCGNLKEVAKVVKALYPDSEIVICGDNDASGAGQKAAKEAALAIGSRYIIPPIVGMDFNDFLNKERV